VAWVGKFCNVLGGCVERSIRRERFLQLLDSIQILQDVQCLHTYVHKVHYVHMYIHMYIQCIMDAQF
jgi:hypothetical protein